LFASAKTWYMSFLSFNAVHGKGDFGIPEDDDDDVLEALCEPMKLKYTWLLWEQVVQDQGRGGNFNDAIRKVTHFSTVQEFWAIWNGIPQPSELIDSKRLVREQASGKSVAIDALMIFRNGISPEWEDPMNNAGGHFQVQLRPNIGGGQIDEFWNNIVLGMIGGTIQPAEMITGVRLVDKLSGSKAVHAIRIELWYTKHSNESVLATLKRNFEKIAAMRLDGTISRFPEPEEKKHTSHASNERPAFRR